MKVSTLGLGEEVCIHLKELSGKSTKSMKQQLCGDVFVLHS